MRGKGNDLHGKGMLLHGKGMLLHGKGNDLCGRRTPWPCCRLVFARNFVRGRECPSNAGCGGSFQGIP